MTPITSSKEEEAREKELPRCSLESQHSFTEGEPRMVGKQEQAKQEQTFGGAQQQCAHRDTFYSPKEHSNAEAKIDDHVSVKCRPTMTYWHDKVMPVKASAEKMMCSGIAIGIAKHLLAYKHIPYKHVRLRSGRKAVLTQAMVALENMRLACTTWSVFFCRSDASPLSEYFYGYGELSVLMRQRSHLAYSGNVLQKRLASPLLRRKQGRGRARITAEAHKPWRACNGNSCSLPMLEVVPMSEETFRVRVQRTSPLF